MRDIQYKSERAFKRALSTFGAQWRIVGWWGEDHTWTIRVRGANQ